nr:hypothetical protein [Wolbachia pipientis]
MNIIRFTSPALAASSLSAMTFIALFTIIRTDRNMLLACYSHKHISYRIRTIIRKAIYTDNRYTHTPALPFESTVQ